MGDMATVVIPAATLFGDGLPDVCWMTGVPARDRMIVTFTSSRLPWAWARALLLLLGGVIAFLLLAISVTGSLAVSQEVSRRRSRARLRTWTVVIAGIVAVAVGFAVSAPAIWVIGLLLLAAGPIVAKALRRSWLPRATVYDDGGRRLVKLEGVHPDFVAAVTGASAGAASA